MLINVFNSPWFEPTGIRLYAYEEYHEGKGTIIVFGYIPQTRTVNDPARGDREIIVGCMDYIFILDRTPDEVAAEINKQIKESK